MPAKSKPKKIFDIFPPETSPATFRPEEFQAPKLPSRKHLRGKKSLILVVGILILTGIFAYFLLPRAQIEIWPETQTLNFKEKVEVSSQVIQPNPGFWLKRGAIPGKVFYNQKSSSQEFLSSGKLIKKEKAGGIIRVYNAYSTSSRVLIPSRFISADGKLFWSLKKEVIPGAKYKEGNLIPGYADIEVQAAEVGEDYNIKPSTFALPALAGSPLYTTIYGKSFSPMTGGFKGEVSQVTQEDLERAENILATNLFEEGSKALENELQSNKNSSDFILLDEAQSQEIVEGSSSANPGDEVEAFNFQVKVGSKALVFKKSDLEDFSKEFILSQVPQNDLEPNIFWLNKKIHNKSLKIDFRPESIDLKSEKIVLNLDITAKIYSDINEISLKKALFGKPLEETRILLEDQPQVAKVQVKFWPFWVKRITQNMGRIKIKLNVD